MSLLAVSSLGRCAGMYCIRQEEKNWFRTFIYLFIVNTVHVVQQWLSPSKDLAVPF